ncbi:MAG: zinc ribbon domain-containing protein, partial [Thermoplasmatota archaeon]
DRIRGVKQSKSISNENEAYNQVKSAQSIARLLQNKGQDTEQASEMLFNAENEIEKGNYSKAKKLAREAKNKLEQNKMNPSTNSEDNEEIDEKMKKGYSLDELKETDFDDEKEMSERAKRMKKQQKRLQALPDNYLESKFELDIVREKIKDESDNEDAQNYFELAEKHFEEGSYTEALKYSVRCKKAIDGDKSGLIGGPKIDREEKEEINEEITEQAEVEEEKSIEQDIEKKEEAEQAEEEIKELNGKKEGLKKLLKCPSCGNIGDLDDRFCSKCGEELVKIYQCPNCGVEISEEDNFCSKCGAEL